MSKRDANCTRCRHLVATVRPTDQGNESVAFGETDTVLRKLPDRDLWEVNCPHCGAPYHVELRIVGFRKQAKIESSADSAA